MKKTYHIVTRAARESAAVIEQFCQSNGQILLPIVNLIQNASHVVENVIHEIGFFQGKYGPGRICVLHEEGVTMPSNIHGLVFAPFPKGLVTASFTVLARELRAFYKAG